MDLLTIKQLMLFSEFGGSSIEDNGQKLRVFLNEYGFSFKKKEIYDYISFFDWLDEVKNADDDMISLTDHFHFGYVIPHISNEIDLLRIGENYNICIEIKNKASEEKKKEQLERDFFYLNFLEKPCYYISFSVNDSTAIILNTEKKEVENIDNKKVLNIIREQEYIKQSKPDLDKFFSIKNYSISPFNDTDKFLKGEYFLTDNQRRILNRIKNESYNYFCVQGKPGTGKSLMAYHLLKELNNSVKYLMVHSGQLNKGHKKLRRNNFNIISAKELKEELNKNHDYDYLIIDEGQRIWMEHFVKINNYCKKVNCKLVIFFDGKQTLSNKDKTVKLIQKLEEKERIKIQHEKLENNKFRYAPNIFKFIDFIFEHKNDDYHTVDNSDRNISLNYFENKLEAEEYLTSLKSKGWEILSFTIKPEENYDKLPKNRNNSHAIIGQEFQRVVVTLNEDFNYSIENELTGQKKIVTPDFYYLSEKMLYQNLTRAKNELKIVVISNEALYLELIKLLSYL